MVLFCGAPLPTVARRHQTSDELARIVRAVDGAGKAFHGPATTPDGLPVVGQPLTELTIDAEKARGTSPDDVITDCSR